MRYMLISISYRSIGIASPAQFEHLNKIISIPAFWFLRAPTKHYAWRIFDKKVTALYLIGRNYS